MIGPAGRGDAGAFLARLLRLDPAAVVRLRPAGGGFAELWARLPFGVLVMRSVAQVETDVDSTVLAAELLGTLTDPSAPPPVRRDQAWRWALPGTRVEVVETIPVEALVRVSAAASATLRIASADGVGGRRVGSRMVRDALLDHVPIVATGPDGVRVEVPQRLVQAVIRMGFVAIDQSQSLTSGDNAVTVRRAGSWIGLGASFGSAWYRPVSPLRMT